MFHYLVVYQAHLQNILDGFPNVLVGLRIAGIHNLIIQHLHMGVVVREHHVEVQSRVDLPFCLLYLQLRKFIVSHLIHHSLKVYVHDIFHFGS